MMSSKNSGFRASDIERYHSGNMTAQERHTLEKAALDDPFLADALEGYAFTKTPAADLAAIRDRLNEKQFRRTVIPFYKKYRWLSAAAAFIILAGSGWLAYKTFTVQKNDYAVVPTEKIQEKKTSNSSAAVNAAPDSSVNNITTSKEFSQKKTESATTESAIEVESVTLQNSAPAMQETANVQDKVSNEERNFEPIARTRNQAETNKNQNARVYTYNAGVIPGVERRYGNRNPVVNLDPPINNADTIQMRSNDIGRIAQTVPAVHSDTVRNLTIVLEPLKMDSAQVVVIGSGTQKKSTEKYPKVIIDTLEPAEGYVSFDDYIANNITMPEELKMKNTSGEVQLSFDVDKDGKPVNITIVKSLCQKCDEEAIRLLKEGPKWKKKNNKKGKITIKF